MMFVALKSGNENSTFTFELVMKVSCLCATLRGGRRLILLFKFLGHSSIKAINKALEELRVNIVQFLPEKSLDVLVRDLMGKFAKLW